MAATVFLHKPVLFLLLLLLFFHSSAATASARKLAAFAQEQSLQMQYHDGPLLAGPISFNLIWYGTFSPSQRSVVPDFLTSLSSSPDSQSPPSVATWWKTTEKYYSQAHAKNPSFLLGEQILDETCSLGKSLQSTHILQLASRASHRNAINIVLTASDVVVEGFCSSRCGTHGSAPRGAEGKKNGDRFAYIWVGNSESQCPGQCAWPFHQPIYGPQVPALVSPNNDVGVDGMIVNLASLVAGTATNPFGNGYFQGPETAPLEAASACPGIYGKGAYPGYAGELLVDSSTGASYNAQGANGRKYLLPALFDLSTSSCSTLVQ